MTAQKVLPVIDEPWMRLVPCPIQTRPVRLSRAPTTRLRMTTEVTTRGRERRFGYGRSRDEDVFEVLARAPARAAVDVAAAASSSRSPARARISG